MNPGGCGKKKIEEAMDISEIWEGIAEKKGGTIVYVIMDGVGGLPLSGKGPGLFAVGEVRSKRGSRHDPGHRRRPREDHELV
jgi:hypothetical protein